MNIRKDDKVVVISGKDKGKEGKVLAANPKAGKLVVEGVSVATKHQKPRKQGEEGGIIKCGKPTRVAHKLDAGKNVRVCKKCGANL